MLAPGNKLQQPDCAPPRELEANLAERAASLPAVFLPVDTGGRLVVFRLQEHLIIRAHPVAHALAVARLLEEVDALGIPERELIPVISGHISVHPGIPNLLEVSLPGGRESERNNLIAQLIAEADPSSRVELTLE